MITITKGRLLTIKQWRETYGPGSNVVLPAEEAEELARIALASLEAKSRKLFTCSGCGAEGLDEPLESKCHCNEDGAHWVEGIVYTAQPAQVSVPDAATAIRACIDEFPESVRDVVEECASIAENACRAAMLHGAEPVSQTYKLPPLSSSEVNDAAWKLHNMLTEHVPLNGRQFNNLKGCFYEALKVAMRNSPVTQDSWISCSERMPVIGELNWRTSFPLLITCEIGVIPAYYGFVSVNGNKHYGFMESLKYGDDNGNHPQTNEYGLISNVTHWMPLPEPPQEAK